MQQAGILIVGCAMIAAAAGAQECPATLSGVVKDPTGAVVVGAAVILDGKTGARTDSAGRVVFRCVRAGPHTLHIEAQSFAPQDVAAATGATEAQVQMRPESVQSSVDAVVSGVDDTSNSGGAKTLTAQDLSDMADDPDDFQTQLQALAAAGGGAPGQAIITVDGFQGSSAMPPKSSIAFIRVNPDMFSSEYEFPPYQGGRIEIYTKPGQDKYHGALFLTYGGSALNAETPFAPSPEATGKKRYGFELSGPVRARKSDFALNFEKRDIAEFAVVNAVSLDSGGNRTNVVQNVATPQTLWIGSARLGMQWGPRTIATLSYTANVNNLTNLGVGGTNLVESGFDSVQGEYALRGTAITTLSPNLVHEARAGFQWRDRDDTPHSTAPSLQVTGAFTAGGIATQAMQSHERNLEVDDDAIWSHGKQTVKAGVQMLDSIEHLSEPANFNGSYTFGGGLAPALDAQGNVIAGQTVTITGLEQYRRALLKLPGGVATSYTITVGTPQIDFNELRLALFVQDDWKLRPRLQLSAGLRYALQTPPATYGNLAPRVGVAWSPDRKQRWVLRARTGLFDNGISTARPTEVLRLDGHRQTQALVYNATYGNPNPTASAGVQTLRQFAPGGVAQPPSWQSQLAVEHDFPRHWHAQANFYLIRGWDLLRSRNVNAPLNGDPAGPRPLGGTENVFQFQQTGKLHGNVIFLGIDQHSMKRLQLFAGYIRQDLLGDADDGAFFPQSSYTDAGEVARPSGNTTHRILAFGQLNLPWKLALSEQLNMASGAPYNVVTGFDNNGDGVFNDRPRYAAAPGQGVYATRFGLLAASGGAGVLPRNIGTMPWTVHLDMNLSRTFQLTRKGDHPQSLALNARSANLLNHDNVTAVGNVLGSPLFGLPYAAEAGRRIEFGARYSF